MSLPLPRRLAQAALLLGAAAAPLVGAGAAHAAALHPQGLGGLSALDGAGLGDTLRGAPHQSTVLAADAGGDAMRSTLPTADHLVGATGHSAVPTAEQGASDAADTAGRILGETAESTAGELPATGALPNLGALPMTVLPTAALPTAGLPTDHLPLKGLPVT
ncbi:ATP-binding protein [Streptomyces sp. V4-01]|uniref:ATP-binding protein n=1 Tax=Actinacidiphila polyblastidii TaxID=3110430 RepID=A0ABU7PC73_9ACTN|nr:ATP-binding protein [Streptomyces sp. V4-01]